MGLREGRWSKRAVAGIVAVIALGFVSAAPADEASALRGSRASLLRQSMVARRNDFTYLRTAADVRNFVRAGRLVPLRGDRNYELAGVMYPYARAEVRTFVVRLAAQYRSACGERLVVTSLTRPLVRQPANASRLSVHPAGMAVDLRRSARSSCRAWLEKTLVQLEGSGVVEATRERHPPHYHVAVFPRLYRGYASERMRQSRTIARAAAQPDADDEDAASSRTPSASARAEASGPATVAVE